MPTERKLIDANEFHAYLEDVRQIYLKEDTFSSNFAAEVIETVQDEYLAKAPAVDAEEVVRCKDCVYEGLHICPIAYIEHQALIFVEHDPNFFCACGERRSDGEKTDLH